MSLLTVISYIRTQFKLLVHFEYHNISLFTTLMLKNINNNMAVPTCIVVIIIILCIAWADYSIYTHLCVVT